MSIETLTQSTSRRTFLKQAGLLTSAALLSSAFTSKEKLKLGLQLYTMRERMAADAIGTLKKISAIGYQELETYGFNPEKNQYYGYDAKAFYTILKDNNLTTSTGHYDLNLFVNKPADDLKRYVDQCMEGAHALHQEYITWPWLDPESRSLDKFKVVAEKLNIIGEQVKKANLTVAYHNGKIGYDIILNETDPSLVKMQMDLYWIANASKLKPHDWFAKYPGRFVMWHLKDMDKVNRDLHKEVGLGTIDFKSIMPDAKLAGVKHVFVEQGNNLMADPFESITISAKYAKQNLL